MQEVKGKLQIGVVRKMDDARINDIMAAIRGMTKLNRDIWDFLPRLQNGVQASSNGLNKTS